MAEYSNSSKCLSWNIVIKNVQQYFGQVKTKHTLKKCFKCFKINTTFQQNIFSYLISNTKLVYKRVLEDRINLKFYLVSDTGTLTRHSVPRKRICEHLLTMCWSSKINFFRNRRWQCQSFKQLHTTMYHNRSFHHSNRGGFISCL